jgi:hypothetical protein
MRRAAAFAFLARETSVRGEVLPREFLAGGVDLEGALGPLIGPLRIVKPAILPEMSLTITTVPEVPGRPRAHAEDRRSRSP